MGLPILNHLLPRVLLVGLDVQPLLLTFLCVPLVLDMVASRLDFHSPLTRNLLGVFSRFQVFHRTTLQLFFVIILEIHYVVSFLNVDTGFP